MIPKNIKKKDTDNSTNTEEKREEKSYTRSELKTKLPKSEYSIDGTPILNFELDENEDNLRGEIDRLL